MSIKIWQSFSCNNSSSYRLVARFAEPMVAAETEAELRVFVVEHAKEIAATVNRTDESYVGLELADKYGLDPDELAMFGVGEISDIEVAVIDDVVVAYHDYSLGFGEAFRGYLRARGAATVATNAGSMVELSVLFDHRQYLSVKLTHQLDALIAQNTRSTKVPFVVPWRLTGHLGRAVVFRDAGTVGMFFYITPDELPAFRTWLTEHGIVASMRLCEPTDYALFESLSKARCTACGRLLQYLDPRIHDIETPQLACTPCGGLYDLSTFEAT